MALLALLEDIANGCIRRERVFRDLWFFGSWWLRTWWFRFPRANLLELWVGPGFGEGDDEESRISNNTRPDYATFSGNRIIPEGIGWAVRSESGSSEPCQSVCFKQDRPHLSQIWLPYDAVNQANIKAQFTAIAGTIDRTHIAIKAPSEGENVYVNWKHFNFFKKQISK